MAYKDSDGTFEGLFEVIFEEAAGIMVDRQEKYGPHNIPRHGLAGIVVRMGDKLARLDNVVLEGAGDLPDETIKDTLLDLVNYAAIGIAVLEKQWTITNCPPLRGT